MIGERKTFKIESNNYDIEKGGVTWALEIQSIFTELVLKSNINQDSDTKNVEASLMQGMRGTILKDIKNVIINTVKAPIIDKDSYEELEPSVIPLLFMEIYWFAIGKAENKKKEPPESSNQETVTSLRI